jgi:hypothetical protein
MEQNTGVECTTLVRDGHQDCLKAVDWLSHNMCKSANREQSSKSDQMIQGSRTSEITMILVINVHKTGKQMPK